MSNSIKFYSHLYHYLLFCLLSLEGKKKKKDQGQHQVILSAFALQYVNNFFSKSLIYLTIFQDLTCLELIFFSMLVHNKVYLFSHK